LAATIREAAFDGHAQAVEEAARDVGVEAEQEIETLAAAPARDMRQIVAPLRGGASPSPATMCRIAAQRWWE